MTLKDEIEATEARLANLKRQAAVATCAEAGHRMKSMGGASARCSLGDLCDCSVQVNECTVCGACDYGEPDREKVLGTCQRRFYVETEEATE